MGSIVERQRQGGIGVVLAIVALDFAGIGLTLPIIPRLLSDVAHTSDLGWRFGAFLSLYALMQWAVGNQLALFCLPRKLSRPRLDCRGGALPHRRPRSIAPAGKIPPRRERLTLSALKPASDE
jgi:hypothetical protein